MRKRLGKFIHDNLLGEVLLFYYTTFPLLFMSLNWYIFSAINVNNKHIATLYFYGFSCQSFKMLHI